MSVLLALAPTVQAALFVETTSVDARIRGPYAELTITQVWTNPHQQAIEGTYTFPLHQDAAVDAAAFRMGERLVRARIERKADARQIYEDARDAGLAASLTEQERPNVFTQSIANLPPGEDVEVLLHVVQPLTYEDGVYSFEYPLVVGPRFLTGEEPQAQALVTGHTSGDTGHRVDIAIDAVFGVPLANVESPSHDELTVQVDGDQAWVGLDDLRADRDVVVRFDLDTDAPEAALLGDGEHFSLLLEPQDAVDDSEVVPRELIFVVDNSGSMSGVPLDMAKAAMREALANLRPHDTFQVLRFSETASKMSPEPLRATPANLRRAHDYVDSFSGMGGTHMLAGIEAALGYGPSDERERIVCLMTDGYIGNERQILAAVDDRLGDARLFSFGLGGSVNRYLLDQLADVGRGDVTYVLLDESPEDAVQRFYDRIDAPVLTDITLDFGAAEVFDLAPAQVPDVFSGQPIRVTGRYEGDLATVTVKGRTGSGPYSETVDLDLVDGDAIASAWARQQVEQLERYQLWGRVTDVEDDITELALAYSLLTAYTSFVAVEDRVVNPSGRVLSLRQTLETPAGVTLEPATSTSVSRPQMRPGDPLLTVSAPADARSVVAAFPWGEVVGLRWDDRRSRWYHRFLVPRNVQDGSLEVPVFVTLDDGRVLRHIETIEIDSSEPEIEAEAWLSAGGTVVWLALDEPLRSVHVFGVGHPDERVRIDLRSEEHLDSDELEVLLPGWWSEVVVVAKDLALNRIETHVEVQPWTP